MKNKNIQLFAPSYHVEECLKEIKECLEKGWTGLGFKTIRFEEDWKKYTGLPNAHFTNSSTIGLHLAVKVYKETLGWKKGDEIITTPLTFVSTNHAILYEGLKPVFADVDDTLCLDPESIRKKITKRTRAVMYVGMGGNAGQLAKVIQLCRKHGLKLILDAAHMAGTFYQKKHAGHVADCTVFSYHAVKNLPTADGGMICFADPKLDAKVRMYSWLGINKDTYARIGSVGEKNYKWHYDIEYVGLKAHGNSVVASIGIVQLKYLDRDNAKRRKAAAWYDKYLPAGSQIRRVKYLGDCLPSRHLYQIRVPAASRDELILFLNGKNIFPGVHYRVNTEYKMYRYALGTCPRAEAASAELVSLPLHVRLSESDVRSVSKSVLEFFKKT